MDHRKEIFTKTSRWKIDVPIAAHSVSITGPTWINKDLYGICLDAVINHLDYVLHTTSTSRWAIDSHCYASKLNSRIILIKAWNGKNCKKNFSSCTEYLEIILDKGFPWCMQYYVIFPWHIMCSGKLSAIQLLKFSVIWTVNLTKQFFLLIVINVSLVMLLVENNFNSVCECKYTPFRCYVDSQGCII